MSPSSSPHRNGIKNNAVRVLPGQYISAAPRISHRRHLLKPSRETNEAFQYLLALCAQKYRMEVYAASVATNYYEVVMYDPDGCHPRFFMDFHRLLTDFLHKHHRIDGNVFSPKAPRVVCVAPDAVADQIARVLANPVTSGGVRYAHEWPGFRTRIPEMGNHVLKGKKPKVFVKRHNLPAEASLPLAFPLALTERYGSKRAAVAAMETALAKHTKAARAAVKRKGWKYLQARGARKVDPCSQAVGWGVFGRVRQRLATTGLSKQDADNAWLKLKLWHERYTSARQTFLEGSRNVRWPFGTWAMVQNFGMEAERPAGSP